MHLNQFQHPHLPFQVTTKLPLSSVAERNAKSSAKLNEASVNVLKTMALLSVAYCLCTAPNGIWFLLYEFKVTTSIQTTFYHFTVIAMFCNCCINPFLYSFNYREFQSAAKALLCMKCRKRQGIESESRSTHVSTVSLPTDWSFCSELEKLWCCERMHEEKSVQVVMNNQLCEGMSPPNWIHFKIY